VYLLQRDTCRRNIQANRSGKKLDKKLEAYLAAEKKLYEQYLSEPKVLILGSSDSGKSTLLKQMKILHGTGFSDTEKVEICKSIRRNLVQSCAGLIGEVDDRVLTSVY
jgi:ABC-type polar amino acid transport system ATPase subunit